MEEEPEPAISGFNGMVRFQNKLIPKKKDIDEKDDDKDVKNVIENSDLVYNSPSVFLKKNKEKKKVSAFSLNSPSPVIVSQSPKKVVTPFTLNELKEEKITYEYKEEQIDFSHENEYLNSYYENFYQI